MILGVGIGVLVVLAVLLIVGAAHRLDARDGGHLGRDVSRRDRGPWVAPSVEPDRTPAAAIQPRQPAGVTPWAPPTAEAFGVTRRRFLNRSVVSLMSVSLAALGGSFLALLWPSSKGGFGSKVHVAKPDIDAGIAHGHGFYYVPEGRMWVTSYPATDLSKARKVYTPAELTGMEAGYVFLYQKCPHLGCRVPSCETSQWFECPCHGSKYNRVGEKKAGPAPRGMDRFPVTAHSDGFVADTGHVILGPPIGTNTTGQEAEGPHCIGGKD